MPLVISCLQSSNCTQTSHMPFYADHQIARMFDIGIVASEFSLYLLYTSNKAVADGAVSYNIDHLITARVAKLTYGIFCTTAFDSKQADHVSRENTKFRSNLSGSYRVPNVFSSILKKVVLSYDWNTLKAWHLSGNSSFWTGRISGFLPSTQRIRNRLC